MSAGLKHYCVGNQRAFGIEKCRDMEFGIAQAVAVFAVSVNVDRVARL